MLKGIDELAKACEPATPEGSPEAAAQLNLSDEQIDKIATRMIEKLQTKGPEPEEAKTDQEQEPEEDPETPDLGEEDTEA